MLAYLEHANLTVANADGSAALLARLFGWHVRWSGPGRDGGRSVHVGTNDHYLALWQDVQSVGAQQWPKGQPLNHVGIVVSDLAHAEAAVSREGLTPFNHGDYAPGRRFYFFDPDGIEYEVVSYAP